jgi:hypothetical protein
MDVRRRERFLRIMALPTKSVTTVFLMRYMQQYALMVTVQSSISRGLSAAESSPTKGVSVSPHPRCYRLAAPGDTQPHRRRCRIRPRATPVDPSHRATALPAMQSLERIRRRDPDRTAVNPARDQ